MSLKRWICTSQYDLDPGRIAAVGASAGGHLVSLLGTTGASLDWDVGEYLDQSSPVTHITPDDPPFLQIHGHQDTVVPLEQSQLMYERPVETGVPAQFIAVQDAGHAPIDPNGTVTPSLDEIYQMISDFLEKHLFPKVDCYALRRKGGKIIYNFSKSQD